VADRVFTKRELLAIYLRQVYLGQVGQRPVLGIAAASEAYFGKHPAQLTVAEAATLSGMLRNPRGYSPIRRPVDCVARRNKVLRTMLDAGYISNGVYAAAVAEPLRAWVRSAT
jgi:penicillin-binding protein 1A